jgi:hypothetical protein
MRLRYTEPVGAVFGGALTSRRALKPGREPLFLP